MSAYRTASRSRKTAETSIELSLNIDGIGVSTIDTGIPFFDHMLTLFSKHGLFDLKVKTVGDVAVDFHHTIEDTGIVIGDCLREALGTKEGIRRYGCAYLPMDETLARVVVDLSNRPHLEFRAPAGTPSAPNMPFTLVEEFCRGARRLKERLAAVLVQLPPQFAQGLLVEAGAHVAGIAQAAVLVFQAQLALEAASRVGQVPLQRLFQRE